MKSLLLLSSMTFPVILLSLSAEGQDNENLNKTLNYINYQNAYCVCVPYFSCEREFPSDDVISTPLEEVSTGDDQKCGNYLYVCCDKERVKGNFSSLSPDRNNHKPCGIRNSIVGDMHNYDNTTEAKYGEFPWMVAVLSEEIVNGSTENLLLYRCGGSLIHPQVVLTSAHCVNSKDKKFSIRAGDWDTKSKAEIFPHQNRNVRNVIIHQDFNSKYLHNDVALLILDAPLEMVDNVGTVCLPPQNEVLENATCVYSSWGKDTFEREGISHDILKKATLPIIQQDECQERFRLSRLGNKFVLDKSFICSEDEDTCGGSGGSPLVCLIPGMANKYYQRGVLSWGLGCSKLPIVYGNVAEFRNWIDDEMLKWNYDSTYYTY